MNSKLRIVVHEDEDISREGILNIVRLYPALDLVVIVPRGENPISTVERIRPKIFITSIEGNVLDGITATRIISTQFPDVSVLAISAFRHHSHVVDIIQAGAKGCVVRDTPKQELLSAIEAMHANLKYFCSRINGIIAHLIATNYFTDFKGRNPVSDLTQKDRMFLKLLCEEKSMKEISLEMEIDIRSLDWRKKKLLDMLHKRTIAGLINFCIVNGLFNPYYNQTTMAV